MGSVTEKLVQASTVPGRTWTWMMELRHPEAQTTSKKALWESGERS